jgi:hypothetical protein
MAQLHRSLDLTYFAFHARHSISGAAFAPQSSWSVDKCAAIRKPSISTDLLESLASTFPLPDARLLRPPAPGPGLRHPRLLRHVPPLLNPIRDRLQRPGAPHRGPLPPVPAPLSRGLPRSGASPPDRDGAGRAASAAGGAAERFGSSGFLGKGCKGELVVVRVAFQCFLLPFMRLAVSNSRGIARPPKGGFAESPAWARLGKVKERVSRFAFGYFSHLTHLFVHLTPEAYFILGEAP